MFVRNLKHLYCACDRVIIRNIRNRRLDSLGANPGLNKRVQAFRKEGLSIVDEDAEEFIEQSESDFMKVQEAYTDYEKETNVDKNELRHHIIKEKYFKENLPNLLTWSEKEQIRHLVNTKPEEWTPERLAESFPVTAHIVKKLVKYPWKSATEERIARHDASAMRNWRELKEGSLDIPEELRNHFLKFSNRTIPPLSKKSIKIDFTKATKMGEYERIIQRCEEKENKKKEKREFVKIESNVYDESRGEKIKKDWSRVTLEELTTRIKQRQDSGKEINKPDQIILNTLNEISTAESPSKEELINEIDFFNTNQENKLTEFKEKDEKVISVIDYPERIRIPKKAYKKGATYKVKDCFYDHDGRFLYRVIGLSN